MGKVENSHILFCFVCLFVGFFYIKECKRYIWIPICNLYVSSGIYTVHVHWNQHFSCWLSVSSGAIYAFITPVLVIFLVCIVFLFVTYIMGLQLHHFFLFSKWAWWGRIGQSQMWCEYIYMMVPVHEMLTKRLR
jgi:hypothetical protein